MTKEQIKTLLVATGISLLFVGGYTGIYNSFKDYQNEYEQAMSDIESAENELRKIKLEKELREALEKFGTPKEMAKSIAEYYFGKGKKSSDDKEFLSYGELQEWGRVGNVAREMSGVTDWGIFRGTQDEILLKINLLIIETANLLE